MLELVVIGWVLASVYILLAGLTYAVGASLHAAVVAIAVALRARRDWPRARARRRFVWIGFGNGPPARFRRGPADYRGNWGA